MKTIIITQDLDLPGEREIISSLVKDGVGIHIRKKNKSESEMSLYLEQFDPSELKEMTLHGFAHLAEKYSLGGLHVSFGDEVIFNRKWKGRLSVSCHTLDEVSLVDAFCDYTFLSPIYDSVSKPGYKGTFDPVKMNLCGFTVYALGGVHPGKFSELEHAGFTGAAICGDFWLSKAGTIKEYLTNKVVDVR